VDQWLRAPTISHTIRARMRF